MSSLNKVQLIGRLGKDPEMRTFESGSQQATFSIATSETFKGKDGIQKQTTEWHNIVLWNKTAEIATKYLHKGDLVYIEGKITQRSWEKEGVTRYITEIVGFNLVMLSPKGSTQNQEAAPAPAAKPASTGGGDEVTFDSSAPKTTTRPPGPQPGDATDDLPF